MRFSPLFLMLAIAGCGSPMLHLVECPVSEGDRVRPCTPYLEVLAEQTGDLYQFEGAMYALDLRTRGSVDRRVPVEDGQIEVLETGEVVEIGPTGAFEVDSLEARHTLEFTATGLRPLRRRAGQLYAEVRDRR